VGVQPIISLDYLVLQKSFFKRLCVEVKTIAREKNDKVTMHPESLARKTAYIEKNGGRGHTVVFDNRSDSIYYREGCGNFRLKNMEKISSIKQLKEKLR
jgi:hypothetical protein